MRVGKGLFLFLLGFESLQGKTVEVWVIGVLKSPLAFGDMEGRGRRSG